MSITQTCTADEVVIKLDPATAAVLLRAAVEQLWLAGDHLEHAARPLLDAVGKWWLPAQTTPEELVEAIKPIEACRHDITEIGVVVNRLIDVYAVAELVTVALPRHALATVVAAASRNLSFEIDERPDGSDFTPDLLRKAADLSEALENLEAVA